MRKGILFGVIILLLSNLSCSTHLNVAGVSSIPINFELEQNEEMTAYEHYSTVFPNLLFSLKVEVGKVQVKVSFRDGTSITKEVELKKGWTYKSNQITKIELKGIDKHNVGVYTIGGL